MFFTFVRITPKRRPCAASTAFVNNSSEANSSVVVQERHLPRPFGVSSAAIIAAMATAHDITHSGSLAVAPCLALPATTDVP